MINERQCRPGRRNGRNRVNYGAWVPKALPWLLTAGHDDERNDGIHGGGRRDLAGLLPADELGTKPQGPARERWQRSFRHGLGRQFWRRQREPVRQRQFFVA